LQEFKDDDDAAMQTRKGVGSDKKPAAKDSRQQPARTPAGKQAEAARGKAGATAGKEPAGSRLRDTPGAANGRAAAASAAKGKRAGAGAASTPATQQRPAREASGRARPRAEEESASRRKQQQPRREASEEPSGSKGSKERAPARQQPASRARYGWALPTLGLPPRPSRGLALRCRAPLTPLHGPALLGGPAPAF
jgi:hypothetical protein